MSDKTPKKTTNPFDIFANEGTRHITVKALNNAKVEIKTALTVQEEQTVKSIMFSSQETVGGRVIPNQADANLARVKTVSMVLVEPKMTMTELGELHGANKAIDEIYDAYMEQREKLEEGN